MVAQVLAPEITWAIKEGQNYPKEDNKLVEVGKTGAENYPKLTNNVILDIQKETTLNSRKNIKNKTGVLPFNTPYLPGQDIPDEDKPRIVGKVFADFKTIGLDGGTFDWEGVFGKDSNGNPGKAKLVFQQWLNNKETNVSYELEVSKDGTYSWKDWQGEPARIPLYSKSLEPYTYSVYLDQDVSEKVKLLTYRIAGTPSGGGFEKDPETGLNIANIVIDLSIQQVASTKFVSEWHTGLAKDARPPVEGEFDNKIDEFPGYFPFSLENNGQIIIRNDFVNNSDYEDPGYTEFGSSSLVKKPEVKVTEGLEFADENDEEGSPTYNLDEANKTITTLDKKHKFKYDFTYDVINGGKLSMTEIISVTFDANGGKFASITEEGADQKIVKEVDYEGTLTDKAEDPTREGKTFKGWSITKGGAIATDADFANIKEAKTFYAIWENNDIKVEELTVSESFNNGTDYVNDFIPTLDTLKGQVEIKDANGVYQKLKDGDSLQILDDSGNPIADGDLKNNLYDKLKEDPATEVSRNLTLKAKVNFADGTSQTVDIPIKVIKNIYEGTSTGGKPSYVPENYVKVTVDPTDKAQDPQKTYYYVNPAAKVVIPGENPEGTGDNVFTKWTMKADSAPAEQTGADYTLTDRHNFTEASTITAQYEKEKQGIIQIKYVDENGEVIPKDKRTGGGAYLEKKQGKIGSIVNRDEFISIAPEFEGYALDRFYYNPKGSIYTENGRNKVTYKYYKKVTTEDKSNDSRHYFKVVFDANGGEFGTEPKTQKDVYIYSNEKGIEKDVQVSFGEVRAELESEYGLPTKDKAEFIEWRDKAADGTKVADNYVVKAPEWVNGSYTPEVFYAAWNEKIEYSIAKIWENSTNLTLADSDYPTMKFALYRQVEGGAEEKVADVEEKEITKDTTSATWKELPKKDSQDKEYRYFVKETFKDKNSDIKNDNWILGDVETTTNESGEIVNTITNKLKTVPAEGETTDPKENFVGKLTIKKVFENEPVPAMTKMAKGPMRVPAAPIKFKFKVTGPYGYESEEFELGANETKTLENLPFGQYKVEETDSKGYTPSYSKEMETLTKDSPNGYIEVTNKNEKSDTNENIIKVTVNKVWVGGGAKPATTIELWRKGYDLNGKEFEQKVDGKFTTEANGANTQSKEFVNLAKHDPSGKEFVYYAKEVKVPAGYTATYSEDGLTVTNTFDIIKDDTPEDQTDKPEGYVTVTFKPGTNGKIDADTKDVVYYVNPKADPVKTMAEITEPSITANTGYNVAESKWKDADGNALDKATEITKDLTYTAQYDQSDDIIKDPTPEDNSDKPEGYVTVTFKAGTNGKIDGNTKDVVYYVNPKADLVKVMRDITPPTITSNQGYKVADPSWKDAEDKALDKATEITKDLTYTAQYEKENDIIPGTGNEKPDGYVTVRFLTNKNGTLKGETVYYVNPNAGKKLSEITAPTITANDGYKVGSPKWKPDLAADTDPITEDKIFVANYDSLGKAEITYISMDTNMGTVSPDSEAIYENQDIAGSTAITKEGYKFVKWTDVTGKQVSTDAKFVPTKKESATYIAIFEKEDTTADKVKKLFDLEGVDLAAFVGDELTNDFWKDGVKSTEKATSPFTEDEKTAIREALKNATVSDASERNTAHEVLSPSKGTLEIKFADGSVLTVLQKLYVYNNGSDKPGDPNHPTPKDKVEVTYKAGEGVENFADKTVLVKKGTKEAELPGKPVAQAKEGYKDLKWTADPAIDETNGVQANTTVTASAVTDHDFAKTSFTVTKVWANDVNPVPTMNFTLYRKVKGSQDEPVKVDDAEVKTITKDNVTATWENLAKTNSEGTEYIYSVKETFKDESADVKNANWILGEMVTDGEGNNTITNKLKTVPGENDTPNENEHRMGKLTIIKKIESKVIQPQMSRSMHRAPAAPLEFTFKVTDPYGNVETFTLKAGESKELNNLLYGDYTVEETDAKGLTPFVKVGEGVETESKTGKVTLTITAKEGTVTFTNKNVKPEENPNIIEVTASKVWVNGPIKDHTAVDLKLSRQVDGGQVEEVTDVTPVKSRDANDVNKFNYVWKDLPKINDKGEKYTYTVEEANVTDNKVTVNGNTYTVSQEGNTITNTYVVPQTEYLIATKQWVGVPDGTATPEVKFQLQRTANGVIEDVGQAMDLTNNQANFGKQDKTDKDGNVYTFSVKEVNADGSAFNHQNYTSEVNGLTVTNTYHAPEVKYTVTYLPGSSTATGTMNPVTVAENTNYTVLANGFTNSGYTFKGWKVGDTTQIIQPGDTINVTGNVTLTAQWENTTTPPTPDPDKPNPDKPNPWDPNPWNPDYPKPWNPNYPDLPYIPRYPEIRYETIVQEKIVKVPVPIADNAYVKEVRYMQGFMGDFRPKDGLTRAEAAQILANALVEDGYKYNKDFKLPYKDIGEAWYTRAVKIVTEAKVFAGYDDGNFKPQDKITRNEWIATLKRFQELGDVSGNHMKLKDGHWAMAEIEAAYKEGWLKIYSDGLATYEGDKFIPREEVAAVSNKAFNRVLDKTYIINNDKNLITYKDVKKDMWSYEDILCASNTFLYKKDLYRAHWIKEDNNQFNINTDGFEIVKAKFQRNPR